jgi:hypothetical protein
MLCMFIYVGLNIAQQLQRRKQRALMIDPNGLRALLAISMLCLFISSASEMSFRLQRAPPAMPTHIGWASSIARYQRALLGPKGAPCALRLLGFAH